MIPVTLNETLTSEIDLATVESWTDHLVEIEQRLGPHFARSEARQRAMAYVQGLLSPAERKNSWQLAEVMGDATPYGFQNLLGRASWAADGVRDELQQYVKDYLADPEAILIIDETGFLKKGQASVGVARQYSGTAGRVENCQIGVFLAYAGEQGQTLLDRELYLPKAWTNDPVRLQKAGVPSERAFATKPTLARHMLARAFAAGLPAKWITADSIYGDNQRLRLWLEEQQRPYVLAVSGKTYVWIGMRQYAVKELLASLPEEGWTRLSAGDGTKGPRWYDWYLIPLNQPLQDGWRRWVLVRRNPADPTDLRAFLVFAPETAALPELVRVAGYRWAIEVSLEEGKGEVGLDEYEVRSWSGWYRHITLALWAQALLAVLRANQIRLDPQKKRPGSAGASSSLADFKAQRGLSSG
jgi:SRSO17 transposase